jgi:hypothetical protein
MKEFMLSGPHRPAMRGLLEWCDEAAVVRWEQETDEEPDWHEAHRRLQLDGRRSKDEPSLVRSRELPNSGTEDAGLVSKASGTRFSDRR